MMVRSVPIHCATKKILILRASVWDGAKKSKTPMIKYSNRFTLFYRDNPQGWMCYINVYNNGKLCWREQIKFIPI